MLVTRTLEFPGHAVPNFERLQPAYTSWESLELAMLLDMPQISPKPVPCTIASVALLTLVSKIFRAWGRFSPFFFFDLSVEDVG